MVLILFYLVLKHNSKSLGPNEFNEPSKAKLVNFSNNNLYNLPKFKRNILIEKNT